MMITAEADELSAKVLDTARAMNRLGINQGHAGNVSSRCGSGFLITPSGMSYENLTAADMVYLDAQGENQSSNDPSSEWRMHRDIYASRPDAEAVVHTHSTFATSLSCLRLDIPAFHYMIAVAGGNSIRCSDYALFGTPQLSAKMLEALEDRRACLLGTHGMICFHDDLQQALWLAVEVEALARQYWHARQLGQPVILDEKQMDEVLERFKSYGRQASDRP